MKKRMNSVVMIMVVICAVMLFTQCRSKHETVAAHPGEIEIEPLCSGPEYFTNHEFFRASHVGESRDQAQSKRTALSNAQSLLANHIAVLVSEVVRNYVQEMKIEDNMEFASQIESMFTSVVHEQLSGTRIICERLTRTPEGRYKTYLAIELVGTEIITMANNRISRDDRLHLEYDRERFKEIFDSEIESLRRDRGF